MVDTQFYINKGPFSLRQIAEICEAELADSGKADVVIKDIATMAKAGAEEICFFYDKKAKGKAAEIKASACVTTAELAPFLPSGVTALIAANPKIAFIKLNEAFYAENSLNVTLRQRQGFIPRRLSVKMPVSAIML